MSGEGPLADHIRNLHLLAITRHLASRSFPLLDTTQFRRKGLQMKLF